jgi:GTP pyrophosphokinase
MQYPTLRHKLEASYSEAELADVDRAYELAAAGHAGQTRADGSAYIAHPVEVADILFDLGLPAEVVIAGLLHDLVEDCPEVTLESVREGFGPNVAKLVDGVTKLTTLPRVPQHEIGEAPVDEVAAKEVRARQRQAETLRKTILAMSDDVRVVLIKLADRLHNMRTLANLRPDKQKRIARETMEIFAPLANRLGIWQLKWQLEDLSFRYLNEDRYREISRALAQRRVEREGVLARIVERLRGELAAHGIDAEVSGRPKHIYSIWKKMERKQVSLDQVYDVRAVRVFVDSVPACYAALGVVHQLGRPLPGEFDDYIASPKENFYQSLHTTVLYEDGRPLEVQIRTKEMHRHAEYGIAAHWRYKEGTGSDEQFQRRVTYLRSMLEWAKDTTSHASEGFVDTLKSEVLDDRVYVFTPRGDAVDLPAGSTVVDFAYAIHTEVGHRTRGARVNGKMVPLSTVVRNGDQVEILTSKKSQPSRDWLTPELGFTRSSSARNKIRAWFRRQDREHHVQHGRAAVDRELKRLRLSSHDPEEVAGVLGMHEHPEEFFARVGRGDLHPQTVVSRLVRRLAETEPESLTLPPPLPVSSEGGVPGEVRVAGIGGMLTQMARCCQPVPGDPIVGYTTRGRGVIVHRRDCPNILKVSERERLLSVGWSQATKTYPVSLRIEVYDREGLLRDVANILAEERINLTAVFVPPIRTARVGVDITIEVTDLEHLLKVMNRIEQLPNVVRVRRTKS